MVELCAEWHGMESVDGAELISLCRIASRKGEKYRRWMLLHDYFCLHVEVSAEAVKREWREVSGEWHEADRGAMPRMVELSAESMSLGGGKKYRRSD